MTRTRILSALLTFAIMATACSADSDGVLSSADSDATSATDSSGSAASDSAESEAEPESEAETEAESPSEAETAPSEQPEPVAGDIVDELATNIAYCTLLDDVDTFFAEQIEDPSALNAAAEDLRARLLSTDSPQEIDSEHATLRGSLVQFLSLVASGEDTPDGAIDALFNTAEFTRASIIVEDYRDTSCAGSVDGEIDGEIDGLTQGPSADFSYDVGLCFDVSALGDIETFDCNEPHDFQIYHTFDIVGFGDEYPGDVEIDLQAEPGCLEAFEDYVGTSYATSIYFYTTFEPSRDSWPAGDREVVCLLTLPNDQLVGDLRGIAQ